MKFYETYFEEYLASNQKIDLHPKLDKLYQAFPTNIQQLKNIIFYGPSGTGKYTQVLKCIKKYSQSELKYEKKIGITYNKETYFFKISDIHYEIDMSLLGCNSKLLWHEIYTQFIDIISAKSEPFGIILCKNFHNIHSELLENFYSYMQQNNAISIHMTFILLTEKISFIPDNILQCCEKIHVPRPTKQLYQKCTQTTLPKSVSLDSITNIKQMYHITETTFVPHKIICDKILDTMIHVENLHFLSFRDMIYDIFIYDLDITECIWYMMNTLIQQGNISSKEIPSLMVKIYSFFQFYNNNYRPIYHVESLLFYIIALIHKYEIKGSK